MPVKELRDMVVISNEEWNFIQGQLAIVSNIEKQRDTHVWVHKEELNHLKNNQTWIMALEQAGVDNWEGYDWAHEIYNEWMEDEG